MLEPRKADIPALFLVLVVLPVVLYILLGKWSDSAKRKERVNLIVQETFEGPLRAEPMAVASAVPLVVPPPPVLSFRECARCGCPATTRCSRCKSVRYCSGKCQIIHWRQGHKEDCWPQDVADSSSRASMEDGDYRSDVHHKGDCAEFGGYSPQVLRHEREESDLKSNSTNIISPAVASAECSAASADINASGVLKPERKVSEKRGSHKSTKEMSERNRVATVSTDANLRSAPNSSKGVNTQHKLRGNGFINSEEGNSEMHSVNCSVISGGYFNRTNDSQMHTSNGAVESNSGSKLEHARQSKPAKSISRAAREQVHPAKPRKGHGSDESAVEMGTLTSVRETNGATCIKLSKTMGVNKSSKISRHDIGPAAESYKKVKVLFPFKDFLRFFELEVFDLVPRGLQNCGNSCYANAVLQCLTCTKPLVAYLLSSMHSRACSLKNWCLMCELEQHVLMLKEAGGPLSPSRILSHLSGTNCQIGNGSQEDAHEFLRLLVTSMQSICLEEVGGESKVHPILQETTFVQQTFGGRLRSMVVCLKCHHESERYENIMDLTLEIFGWVESLEDALTQFTTPEDLEGENMYRCTRCASYVRARKQLSIDEAPNILTIVLKRFQEGNYGKINKCISFPEMLDMVPFMTGTNDIPPLYTLYGVVVHVDTLNASFSGHYVSYVKDLQGNWYRIDDSVIQPVPMSQVMSEGAYILFYRRSSPRPPRSYIRKATRHQVAKSSRPHVANTYNYSETGQNFQRAKNNYTHTAQPNFMEFADAASSDWSLFTSSDEASFTSESTRDSFSTADYSDTCRLDPFSSMFKTRAHRDRPSQRTISCRMFSGSKPVTGYVTEETTGYILGSYNFTNPLDEVQIGGDMRQVSVPFNEAYLSDSGYQNFVNYGTSSSQDFIQTFSNFQL